MPASPPSFAWQLRRVMADRGVNRIADLNPALTDLGIPLSRAAIYRAISAPPTRISLNLLAALCETLDCTPNDLLQPWQECRQRSDTNNSWRA